MTQSVSHLMQYSRRRKGTQDFVGGLPSHLPYVWPLCQLCQERMAFVGQLCDSQWLSLDGHQALQFYVCDNCRKSVRVASASGGLKKGVTLSVAHTLHLEALPATAKPNSKNDGVRCKFQPKRHISYTPVEDSVDQWTFNRRSLDADELPDTHLRDDKVGGLFPYGGSDGPKITKTNRMIAQLRWQGFGGTIYLYQSSRAGFYPYLYY